MIPLENLSPEAIAAIPKLNALQVRAVENLIRNQAERFTIGVSPGIVIQDFAAANKLMKTEPERAKRNLEDLFDTCNHNPRKTL